MREVRRRIEDLKGQGDIILHRRPVDAGSETCQRVNGV